MKIYCSESHSPSFSCNLSQVSISNDLSLLCIEDIKLDSPRLSGGLLTSNFVFIQLSKVGGVSMYGYAIVQIAHGRRIAFSNDSKST